jgi:hypothetical protein
VKMMTMTRMRSNLVPVERLLEQHFATGSLIP